jgi:dihydroorotase
VTRLCILGGRVLDPVNRIQRRLDIVVRGGRIGSLHEPGDKLASPGSSDLVLDASGCLVLPGLIDLHVHLREPGMESAEDVGSGTRAAAAGGFTTVVCQPNTRPVMDNVSTLARLQESIGKNAVVNVIPAVALSLKLAGKRLSPIRELAEAGAGALSDDGVGTGNLPILTGALQTGKQVGLPVMVHCEEHALSSDGVMTAGPVARHLGLKGIPASAERLATQRAIRALRRVGGKLHVQHVSTAGALKVIRRAKDEGLDVTCEVTPHHLLLTHRAIRLQEPGAKPDPNLKMNPPLRTARDVQALRDGLSDGTVDAVASDHAPHTLEAKQRGFDKAPFGVTGLETTLSIMLLLVDQGIVTLRRAVELLTSSPGSILGRGGSLSPGAAADIAVVDPKASWCVDSTKMISKSSNTAFSGWRLSGTVKWTLVDGRVVYESSREGT